MDGVSEGRSDAAERAFDWCKIPASKQMIALVQDVRRQLLNYERYRRPRKRQRRKADQDRFDRMVSGVVCELVHCAFEDREQWCRISLSNRMLGKKNVGPEFVTEQLRTIVDDMATPEMDWVELVKGTHSHFGSKQSTIRASERLQRYARDRKLAFADIGRDVALTGDPIELRSEKVKDKAEQLDVPSGEPAETFRREMVAINGWLATADIGCDETNRLAKTVDTNARWLRRIFNNGSLEQGGRLYGGFWSQMSAEDRLRHIMINGEGVVGLDYGQCAVRIAYGQAGAKPPEGDLYDLKIKHLDPLRYRAGVKKVLNAMFFSGAPLMRKPMGSAKELPKNYTIEELQEKVRERHAPIASLFHVGFGMRTQFIESQILVRCLLALRELSVVALPVHDCLVVPCSAKEVAQRTMLECFREIAGVDGVVDGSGLKVEGKHEVAMGKTIGRTISKTMKGVSIVGDVSHPSPLEGGVRARGTE